MPMSEMDGTTKRPPMREILPPEARYTLLANQVRQMFGSEAIGTDGFLNREFMRQYIPKVFTKIPPVSGKLHK